MRTTKKLIVLCLALLMGIAAIMPSTFSWYDHSGSQTGDRMTYEREDLPVSAGNITIETKKYEMDGANTVKYDQKGNKSYDGGAISGGEVTGGHSQYYGTTITNTGAAPAYVNLYLQNFKNNSSFFVGTTAPSLRDKGIASSVHIKNKNMVRVYFQWNNANNWNDPNAKHYVVYKTKTNSNWESEEITSQSQITAGAENSALLERQTDILGSHITDTYYVNLADDTTQFFFATDGNNSGFDTSDCSTTMNWYRTNIITDVQAERGYYLTGSADDTYFTAAYETFPIQNGVSVMKYFDTANLNSGQKSYVSLVNGTHYTGQSVSYSVSGSGLTVNSGSGLITRTGTGTATVTTTITGSLGDTTTVTTAVSTPPSIAAMPLAMNIEVPGRTTKDGETVDGTAEVVWYIRNESSSDTCTFDGIYYTK